MDSESGASIAWRLLATLEGSSLLLVTSALLVYTASTRLSKKPTSRTINTVLITNTSNIIGKTLKHKLESRGCTVHTHPSEATRGAGNEHAIDALIVVGAENVGNGLNGLSRLVTEDVYQNLNLLESMAPLVRHGGCIVWTCAGRASDTYSDTTQAFDAILRASLQSVCKTSYCEPIWVGRCGEAERAADQVLAALFPRTTHTLAHTWRNWSERVAACLERCWKVT